MTKIYKVELDGKEVAYHSATEFLVQVGYKKSGYKTQYKIVGNLAQAVLFYRGINVGNGYKKRLLMPACTLRPVLARSIS